MNDYGTLATLISSSILISAAIAYYFGSLESELGAEKRDKNHDIVKGFLFLKRYVIYPLAIIAILEIYMHCTQETFSITLILVVVLLIQAFALVFMMSLLKERAGMERIERYLDNRVFLNLVAPIIVLSLTNVGIFLFSFIEIAFLYMFIKSYLSGHIFFFNLDVPTDFGVGLYVIVASILTFVSLIVVRLLTITKDLNYSNVVVQMKDGATVKGKLRKWDKFITLHINDDTERCYINENDIIRIDEKRILR